jgi:hypothetical protein
MHNRMRNSLGIVRLVIIVALAACAAVGCVAFGPRKTHAKLVAVDVRSGRILWSSHDLSHIAEVQKPSVEDAAHTVTIVGYNEKTKCGPNPSVAVVLDEHTGRYLSRHDSAPPTPADDTQSLADGSVPIRDADAQWNAFINADARTIVIISADYTTRRNVDLHRALGQRHWDQVSAAFHNGVLYAAFTTENYYDGLPCGVGLPHCS